MQSAFWVPFMTKGWISILGLIHEWRKAESAFSASVVNGCWAESAFSALFMNDATLNHHSQPQSEMMQGWIGILSFIHAWCRAESASSASFMLGAGLNRHPQLHSCMVQGWIGFLSFIHAWCRAESACFGIIHELKHSTYRSVLVQMVSAVQSQDVWFVW